MTDNHRDPESLARGQTFPPPRPRTRTCVATPHSTHAREPALASMALPAPHGPPVTPPPRHRTASHSGHPSRAAHPVCLSLPPFSLSLVCWACTRTVNTHPPAAGHANPPPTRSAPRVAIDLDVAWTLGCAYYLRRLDHAHTLMHTPADVIRCSALPCPAWLLLSQPARGTVQSFFCFFFLAFPRLAWAVRERRWGRDRRCFGACGQASGSRMLGRCSSCCGMCEAGLFVVVYSETNSLVSDRETGRFACVVRDLRCRGLSSGILLVPTPENTVGPESRTRGSSAAYVTRLPAPSGGGVSLRRAAAGGERVRG
jgi:hypothetical protein